MAQSFGVDTQTSRLDSSSNQHVGGDLGTLYGQIDAPAICNRLSAAMATRELTAKDSNQINVYLQVNQRAAFSADYWAGWADTVFNAPFTENATDGSQFTSQPFLPCIMCAFTRDGAVLRIDPHVPVALKRIRKRRQAVALPGRLNSFRKQLPLVRQKRQGNESNPPGCSRPARAIVSPSRFLQRWGAGPA